MCDSIWHHGVMKCRPCQYQFIKNPFQCLTSKVLIDWASLVFVEEEILPVAVAVLAEGHRVLGGEDESLARAGRGSTD